jgi:hypothetical protein
VLRRAGPELTSSPDTTTPANAYLNPPATVGMGAAAMGGEDGDTRVCMRHG